MLKSGLYQQQQAGKGMLRDLSIPSHTLNQRFWLRTGRAAHGMSPCIRDPVPLGFKPCRCRPLLCGRQSLLQAVAGSVGGAALSSVERALDPVRGV